MHLYLEREGECVQAVLPSVWPKASLVDYVTQQWQWPFTVGACSNSWKAYKHASLPPFSLCSPTRIDIVPWQMQVYSMSLYLQMSAPVSDERQIKKKSRLSHRMHFNRAAWMASHMERYPLWRDKKKTDKAVSTSSRIKEGQDGRLTEGCQCDKTHCVFIMCADGTRVINTERKPEAKTVMSPAGMKL